MSDKPSRTLTPPGRFPVCPHFTRRTLLVFNCFDYEPFYQTLQKRGITEYHLIYKEVFSANTLHRMKHGKTITLKTLDTLCFILDGDIPDVIQYVKDE